MRDLLRRLDNLRSVTIEVYSCIMVLSKRFDVIDYLDAFLDFGILRCFCLITILLVVYDLFELEPFVAWANPR